MVNYKIYIPFVTLLSHLFPSNNQDIVSQGQHLWVEGIAAKKEQSYQKESVNQT